MIADAAQPAGSEHSITYSYTTATHFIYWVAVGTWANRTSNARQPQKRQGPSNPGNPTCTALVRYGHNAGTSLVPYWNCTGNILVPCWVSYCTAPVLCSESCCTVMVIHWCCGLVHSTVAVASARLFQGNMVIGTNGHDGGAISCCQPSPAFRPESRDEAPLRSAVPTRFVAQDFPNRRSGA